MATVHAVARALIPMAISTTLSAGAIAIILDQDSSGITIIVAYTTLHGLRDGDEYAYCQTIEDFVSSNTFRHKVSKIITAKFQSSPKSLNGITIVHSRHAVILYWDQGVCLYTKRGSITRV